MTTIVNKMSSSKAAEIYRKDSGGIYYVCYHCGTHFSTIADTLAHIEHHFSSSDNIRMDQMPADVADIKCELLDDVSQGAVDVLEQIFIDCSKSMSQNEEQALQITTNTSSYAVLPLQQTSAMPKENFSDMEGHFEWKCLYCASLWKNFTELKKHLRNHTKDPLPSVMHESIDKERSSTTRVRYSFKCTLCPSEFYDSSSSRQHISIHDPEPMKSVPCGRKFVSAQLFKDHMATVHTNGHGQTTEPIIVDKIENGETQLETSNKTLLSQRNTFLCILCNKTFNGTLNLMQHTFVHFNLKIFKCPQCPAKFQQMVTIKDHLAKNHSTCIDEQIFNIRCRFCGDNSENLFEFVTHTFTNHLDEGERNNSDLDSIFNFDCRFCFMNFTKWTEAYQHLKAHANDELPKCLPPVVLTARCYSQRAKSGLHRCEFLYNCNICAKTLCGSFEARNHSVTEHKNLENEKMDKVQTLKKSHLKGCLKCHDCDDAFYSPHQLMKHRLMHFKVLPYRCMVCAKKFSISKNATSHMIKIHHMNSDANFSQLECHYCKAEFDDETDFITHMYNDHLYVNFNIEEDLDEQCKYECLYCNELIPQRSQMSEHLKIHQNETISAMDTEGNSTSAESAMNKLRHTVEFMYCCVYCPKKFRLPHTASEHVRYKHKTEKINTANKDTKPVLRDTTCCLCNITFLTYRSMLNHKAKLHPETHKKDRNKNRPTYYCSTCGKAYRDRGNLNQHEETHTRLQSYTCDICNKTYRSKNYIQTHMYSHTNEKNFVCEQCGRSFYCVSKLNTHYQIHQNLKLKCDQCDKVFFTRYNLSKHKKIHTVDTRKKCKLCDNYFKSNNSYRTHMLLHTGVKKYACRYCDMTFAQSSGRRGHEKMRHHVA